MKLWKKLLFLLRNVAKNKRNLLFKKWSQARLDLGHFEKNKPILT